MVSALKDKIQGKLSQRKKIGEVLVDLGLINADELETYLKRASAQNVRLGEYLVLEGVITEDQLAQALADQFGMLSVDLIGVKVNKKALEKIPERIITRYHVLPYDFVEGNLVIAVHDPLLVMSNQFVQHVLPDQYEVRIASLSRIKKLIESNFGGKGEDSLQSIVDKITKATDEKGIVGTGSVSVEALIDRIIEKAANDEASDVHIDPAEKFLRIRERIDGVLHEVSNLSLDIHPVIISRLKVLGKIDIAEKRKAQDGRFQFRSGNRIVDIRLSTLPTIKGEKAVMRLLDKSKFRVRLTETGFAEKYIEQIREVLKVPNGIVLTTGPTGSGKTTTTYAMLNEINTIDKNIITVEDPVEYQFDIINQVQVNEKKSITFASILRNILRQDPDIIMVGEVRDRETAEIAIRAALTGHLVLSTIHTNDAISTISRLLDMGVEPFLISSSLSALVAQRLVRTLCPQCRVKTTVTQKDSAKFGKGLLKAGTEVYAPSGCDACHKTGYRGRTAICELLFPDDEVRKMITDHKSQQEILSYLKTQGFQTMRENAIEKILDGTTSIEEVVKATV